jgi:hypothetical protein
MRTTTVFIVLSAYTPCEQQHELTTYVSYTNRHRKHGHSDNRISLTFLDLIQ